MLNKKIFFLAITLFLSSFSFTLTVYASTPTISLTTLNSASSQITVYGDTTAPIKLYYGSSASTQLDLGSTDQNGNFSTILSTESYAVSCGNTAYVIINGVKSQTISWQPTNVSCNNASSGSPSFSKNNVTVNVGQSESITIQGTGGYTVSSNSNPSTISTSITGNILNLYANTFGGASITVCESDNACAAISVVAVNNSYTSPNSQSSPTLSSFSVSSNDTSKSFAEAGNVLTVIFNTNKPVKIPLMTFDSSFINVSSNLNSGSGPFVATYTVTGNEPSLVPVVISLTDLLGNNSKVAFAIGNLPTVVQNSTVQSVTTNSAENNTQQGCTGTNAFNTLTGASCGTAPTVAKYKFTKFLDIDSIGDEVTELQKRLTSLGFYTGPVTGKFGGLTQAAVKKFQKARSITQAGYVGPSTREALNK